MDKSLNSVSALPIRRCITTRDKPTHIHPIHQYLASHQQCIYQNHRQTCLFHRACYPHHISATGKHHASAALRSIPYGATSAYQRPVAAMVEWPSLHTVAYEDGGAAPQIRRRMFPSVVASVPTGTRAYDDECTGRFIRTLSDIKSSTLVSYNPAAFNAPVTLATCAGTASHVGSSVDWRNW